MLGIKRILYSMTNPQKRKGTRWENDAVKLLNEAFPNTWRRVALSGAIGTVMNMPILKADIFGKYNHLSKRVVGECKVGYGGKQMTVHKDWFDHIQEVADESYSIPAVVLKFEKSRSGVRHIICLSFETWDELMRDMAEMHEELKDLHKRLNGDE
jgi:hypothetical protein